MENIEISTGANQRDIYDAFKSYCKNFNEVISENGVRTLNVANNNGDLMTVSFVPKTSGLSAMHDTIDINGKGCVLSFVNHLIKIGYSLLGQQAFYDIDQVKNRDEANCYLRAK